MPLKPVNDALNEFRELYKRWDNRLTLKNIDIAERYIKSGLQLLADLHIRGRGDDIDLRAIVHRADETILEGYCNPALKGSCHVWYAAEKYDRQNQLVFVGYVEVMDGPERVIPSFVRFQTFDYLDDIWAGAVYLSLLNSLIKIVPFACEREINLLDVPPVEPNKIACQQIQGGSEVVNRVTDDQGNLIRKLFRNSDDPTQFSGLSIVLKNDTVRISFEKCTNFVIEIRDVALGPFNL